MGDHTDPRKPFYIAVMVANNDGTIDIENECPQPYGTEQEAIEAASNEAGQGGGEFFVYRCVPLCRVHRIAVTVERLPATAPDAAGE